MELCQETLTNMFTNVQQLEKIQNGHTETGEF